MPLQTWPSFPCNGHNCDCSQAAGTFHGPLQTPLEMTGCVASVFVSGEWAHNAAGSKISLFIVFLLKSPPEGTLNHLFQEPRCFLGLAVTPVYSYCAVALIVV